MSWYGRVVVGFSVVFVCLGVALLVVTASNGGGLTGYVVGALFIALGVARITLERKRGTR